MGDQARIMSVLEFCASEIFKTVIYNHPFLNEPHLKINMIHANTKPYGCTYTMPEHFKGAMSNRHFWANTSKMTYKQQQNVRKQLRAVLYRYPMK